MDIVGDVVIPAGLFLALCVLILHTRTHVLLTPAGIRKTLSLMEDEHERSEYLRGLDLAHAIALMASQLPDDWEVIADESGQLRIMPPPRPAPPS